MPPRRLLSLVVGLGLVVVGSGCRENTVRLSFRPSVGDRSNYVIQVRAVAVTNIGDEGARRTVHDRLLTARHRVLESSADGSRVEVRLSQELGPTATFIVRYDRTAQPIAVERVEGLPADTLGDLGLSELFPAAAAAPPDRPLEPGARWEIDEPVSVAGARPARLAGEGQLVALQAAAGRRLAHVSSSYRIPVRRTSAQPNGRLRLEGTLATRARVAYDLDDDVVQSVRARTRGRYDVTLLPPPGVAGMAVPGTMDVNVDSTTRRIS